MELINELGTDLAFAFLVEKRFRHKIDSHEAVELIDCVRQLLESNALRSVRLAPDQGSGDGIHSASAH